MYHDCKWLGYTRQKGAQYNVQLYGYKNHLTNITCHRNYSTFGIGSKEIRSKWKRYKFTLLLCPGVHAPKVYII